MVFGQSLQCLQGVFSGNDSYKINHSNISAITPISSESARCYNAACIRSTKNREKQARIKRKIQTRKNQCPYSRPCIIIKFNCDYSDEEDPLIESSLNTTISTDRPSISSTPILSAEQRSRRNELKFVFQVNYDDNNNAIMVA